MRSGCAQARCAVPPTLLPCSQAWAGDGRWEHHIPVAAIPSHKTNTRFNHPPNLRPVLVFSCHPSPETSPSSCFLFLAHTLLRLASWVVVENGCIPFLHFTSFFLFASQPLLLVLVLVRLLYSPFLTLLWTLLFLPSFSSFALSRGYFTLLLTCYLHTTRQKEGTSCNPTCLVHHSLDALVSQTSKRALSTVASFRSSSFPIRPHSPRINTLRLRAIQTHHVSR